MIKMPCSSSLLLRFNRAGLHTAGPQGRRTIATLAEAALLPKRKAGGLHAPAAHTFAAPCSARIGTASLRSAAAAPIPCIRGKRAYHSHAQCWSAAGGQDNAATDADTERGACASAHCDGDSVTVTWGDGARHALYVTGQ